MTIVAAQSPQRHHDHPPNTHRHHQHPPDAHDPPRSHACTVHAPLLALALPDTHAPCALGLVPALTLTLTLPPCPHHHEDSVTPSPIHPPSFTLVLQMCTRHCRRPHSCTPTRMAHAPSFTLTSPDMHMRPESHTLSPTCTLAFKLPSTLGHPHAPSFSPTPLNVHMHRRLRVVLHNMVRPGTL